MTAIDAQRFMGDLLQYGAWHAPVRRSGLTTTLRLQSSLMCAGAFGLLHQFSALMTRGFACERIGG
jgi:hypothetical protein